MKKLAILLLAIIISTCAVSSAFAAKWVELYRDDKILISCDLSSLQYNGSTIRVWEKWIYRKEEHIKELSKAYKSKSKVAYSLIHKEYDVKNGTSKDLGATFYDKNGNSIGSYGEQYEWTQIPPDTIGDFLLILYKALLKIE